MEATDLFIPDLYAHGYDLRVGGSTRLRGHTDFMAGVDLVLQCTTMSTIEGDELAGLLTAIEHGIGLAGWHEGIADSHRNTRTTCISSADSSPAVPANIPTSSTMKATTSYRIQ